MSTRNFPAPSCGKHYVIGMNVYDRDEVKREMEMQSDDPNEIYECDVDEHIDFLIECDVSDAEICLSDCMKELGFIQHRDDNLYTKTFDYKYREKGCMYLGSGKGGRFEDTVTMEVSIKCGYYEGAIIDWDLSQERKDLPKKTQKEIEKLEKIMHEKLKVFTTQINCLGVMSNGEAIYQLA